jgi:hypothetical protein
MQRLLRSFSLSILIVSSCEPEPAVDGATRPSTLTAEDVAFIEGWQTWKFDPFAAEEKGTINGWRIIARKEGANDMVLAEVLPQNEPFNDGSPCSLLFALKIEEGTFVCSYRFTSKDLTFSQNRRRVEAIYSGHLSDLETEHRGRKTANGHSLLFRATEVVGGARRPIDVLLEFHRTNVGH